MSTQRKPVDALVSDGEHFAREDLIGLGDVVLTLADPPVVEESVLQAWNNQRAQKKVLRFAGTDRGLVLNSGNRKRLIKIFGTIKTRDWPKGAKVVLRYDPDVKAAKGNSPGGIVILPAEEKK